MTFAQRESVERALEELQTSTGESSEFMTSLILLYLQQAEQVRCLIGAAQPDRSQAAKAAHSFAGASLILGLTHAAEIALELERSLVGRSDTVEDRQLFLEHLDGAVNFLSDWMQSPD